MYAYKIHQHLCDHMHARVMERKLDLNLGLSEKNNNEVVKLEAIIVSLNVWFIVWY